MYALFASPNNMFYSAMMSRCNDQLKQDKMSSSLVVEGIIFITSEYYKITIAVSTMLHLTKNFRFFCFAYKCLALVATLRKNKQKSNNTT